MKGASPDVFVVLWGYFRRYRLTLAGALLASLAYALATVLLLALFRPILSEVLLADGQDLEGVAALALGSEEDEAAPEAPRGDPVEAKKGLKEWLADTLGIELDIDLEALFSRWLERVKTMLGIDAGNVVWGLPLLFIVVFLTRSLAAFANGYLFQRVGLGATNDLRNDLYGRILHQSSRFYSQHPSGELVSRVSNDVAVMQNAVSSRLLDLFQQGLTLVLLVWYLLSAHFQLAAMCLVLVPAVVYPIVKFGRGMRRTSHHSQERLADLANLVAEAVRGYRVVKAFGMEDFELARFRQATGRHLEVRLKAQLLAYASSPVIESLAAIGSAAFLIYAGNAVRAGELTASQLVQFLTNLIMLYDPVRKLNKVNLVMQESLAAAQRVVRVMHVPNDIIDRPGAIRLPILERAICFDGVSFSYDEEGASVLQGIDLEIRRGEVVALVGASGAGKSTLVNLLPRFFDPDEGAVRLDGHDLREVTLESLRAQIGMVTQDTVLFNDTIRNNIAYGRDDLPFEAVRAAAQAAYADDFIAQQENGYDTVIGESGSKLSGGQRQRLAIARALLKDPPILILDEATSHLDSEAEALVQKALSRLMEGRTALVIAHRLSTVQRADRILVMDAGRIVEQGDHRQLLAAGGIYKNLYNLQFRDD